MQTPAEVAEDLIAAENAHDLEAALALFADDAVVNLPMGSGTLTTPAEIRDWQATLTAEHVKIDIHKSDVQGDVVMLSGLLAVDRMRKQGIEAVNAQWRIEVLEGLIRSFTVTILPPA
jgi:ketosteroid isomerase-like protein